MNPDALDDPELRERIARAHTDIEYTRLLNYRALSKILQGREELARGARWPSCSGATWPRPSPSWPSTCSGPPAMLAKGGPDAVDGGAWNRLYVFQRYTSIGAGTTEVQKNIIADRAIRMPKK